MWDKSSQAQSDGFRNSTVLTRERSAQQTDNGYRTQKKKGRYLSKPVRKRGGLQGAADQTIVSVPRNNRVKKEKRPGQVRYRGCSTGDMSRPGGVEVLGRGKRTREGGEWAEEATVKRVSGT